MAGKPSCMCLAQYYHRFLRKASERFASGKTYPKSVRCLGYVSIPNLDERHDLLGRTRDQEVAYHGANDA